ncbi:hypothetical protein QMP26_05370 [Enterocloster clostridioformis]|uniref:hypothetical protein n=1 Tax=Enterocloster clostridioformis TaxID=1531 RepID=UPI0026764AEF|nr:hypothetical protein [Enterocloster clostridioformis]
MLVPLIKIKEGDKVHIVGTNSHDELIIQNNAIHYLNLQGMVGTQYPDESGMYFVPKETTDEYDLCPWATVEMVTLEELVAIAIQNMKDQTKASLKLHEIFRNYLVEKEICAAKRDDDISDTSGMLF